MTILEDPIMNKPISAEGWVLVPVTPTEEMVWAGNEAAETCVKLDPCGKAAQHVWSDMIAASPPHPEGEGVLGEPFAWTIVDVRTASFMNGYICKSREPAEAMAKARTSRFKQYVAVPLFLAGSPDAARAAALERKVAEAREVVAPFAAVAAGWAPTDEGVYLRLEAHRKHPLGRTQDAGSRGAGSGTPVACGRQCASIWLFAGGLFGSRIGPTCRRRAHSGIGSEEIIAGIPEAAHSILNSMQFS